MHNRFALALCLVLVAASTAMAGETAEKVLTHEAPLAKGASLSFRNLLGSMTVRSDGVPGVLKVEARVVSDAETREQAHALVDAVQIVDQSGDDGRQVEIAFPVERHSAFRMPRSDVDGLLSKWVTPFLKRSTVATSYGGRSVEVGTNRKATALVVHLKIILPLDVGASFHQVVGTLQVSGMRGQIDVEIVEGSIRADQIYGDLLARTGGGKIDVTKFRGDVLELQTSTGELSVKEVKAKRATLRTASGAITGSAIDADTLFVDTGSGDVILEGAEPATLQVQSISGAVDLGTRLQHLREADIRSESGDVVLRMGRLAPFELDAQSESGDVKLKGLAADVLEQGDSLARLRRRVGGAALKIATTSGDVTLRPL